MVLHSCTAMPPPVGFGTSDDSQSENVMKQQYTHLLLTRILILSYRRRLARQQRATLWGTAETLHTHPDLRLEVAGHTDAEGDDAFNLDLSHRRPESVRAYLISNGIRPGNLSARGYGEQQPVQSNQTAQGRAENRHVELLRTDASP